MPKNPLAGMTLRKVFVVRHGERIDHVDREWHKTAKLPFDPPLTSRGLSQATETGRFLANRERIHRVFASPFYRTVQTAVNVAEGLDLPVLVEWGACEWLNAAWYGKEQPPALRPIENLLTEFPRLAREYESFWKPSYPETETDVRDRCRSFAENVKRTTDGNSVIVGHGISVEMLVRGFCTDDTQVDHVTYCSVTEVNEQKDGSWVLGDLHTSTAHLSEPEAIAHVHYQ